MNQRTAKLIQRFAVAKQVNPRNYKRAWNRTPRKARSAFREDMRDLINQ